MKFGNTINITEDNTSAKNNKRIVKRSDSIYDKKLCSNRNVTQYARKHTNTLLNIYISQLCVKSTKITQDNHQRHLLINTVKIFVQCKLILTSRITMCSTSLLHLLNACKLINVK